MAPGSYNKGSGPPEAIAAVHNFKLTALTICLAGTLPHTPPLHERAGALAAICSSLPCLFFPRYQI